MTQEEHDKWERYYQEAADRDFASKIYEQCDREDQELLEAAAGNAALRILGR